MKRHKTLFTAEVQRYKGILVPMRFCKKNCCLILLFFLSQYLKSQPLSHYSSVKDYETLLRPLAKTLLKAPTDSARDAANKKFIQLFEEALKIKDSYTYNFDSLINLKVLTAEDGKLRIYTWVFHSVDGNIYEYYGYVQVLQKKAGISGLFSKEYTIVTTKLRDGTREIPDPQNNRLKPERWYGAWYYKLITNSYLGKSYYTLLGWKGNNKLTTIKVIDNIAVSNDGKITFGVPVFKDENIVKCREVFEFSANVSMSLHYETDKKITAFEKAEKTKKRKLIEYKNVIVFDHIVAPEGKLEGQRQFYGPDLSLDAYYFKNGKWLMLHDVDDKPSSSPLPPAKYHAPKGLYSPPKKK